MAKKALRYDEKPVTKWNAANFRQYMQAEHESRFKIAYTPRSVVAEASMIKNMVNEYGPELVKEFIDAVFADYKPSRDYPGINFAFMYSWKRDAYIPRLLAKQRQEERRAERAAAVPEMSEDELLEWL